MHIYMVCTYMYLIVQSYRILKRDHTNRECIDIYIQVNCNCNSTILGDVTSYVNKLEIKFL